MLERAHKPRPPSGRSARRSSAGARSRRYRQRKAHGEATALVTYDGSDLDKLIALEVLREQDAADREAVGRAFRQLLRNVQL